MLCTPIGITMLFIPLPLNAFEPIIVTSCGITVVLQPHISLLVEVSIIALHPSVQSYTVLSSTTTIESNLLHL